MLFGTPDRSLVACDHAGLVTALTDYTATDAGLPLLRLYWYDASLQGLPTSDQEEIAGLPGVKIRLGRLVRSEQKGVDSRIVRDMIVLAHDRAMTTAYLVAGDEDLREGIAEAQECGVRVLTIGVPGVNQSPRLIQEADANIVLPEELWRPFFSSLARPPSVEALAPRRPVPRAPLIADRPAGRPRSDFTPVRAAFERLGNEAGRSLLEGAREIADAFEQASLAAGRSFADAFLRRAAPQEIDALVGARRKGQWQIPKDLDVQLLRTADAELDFLWERPELKVKVRDGFWERLLQEVPPPTPPTPAPTM